VINALGIFIGAGLAGLGVWAMRNPLLLPGWGFGPPGYYQRVIRDSKVRFSQRMLGMIASFFGLMILTGLVNSVAGSRFSNNLSNAFLAMLVLAFMAAFAIGFTFTVVEILRGRWKEALFGGFGTLPRQVQFEPASVDPPLAAKMKREAMIFTVMYCLFVLAAIASALL